MYAKDTRRVLSFDNETYEHLEKNYGFSVSIFSCHIIGTRLTLPTMTKNISSIKVQTT